VLQMPVGVRFEYQELLVPDEIMTGALQMYNMWAYTLATVGKEPVHIVTSGTCSTITRFSTGNGETQEKNSKFKVSSRWYKGF
jgi:hypothetical protein